MDKIKLGLQITCASGGYKEMLTVNPGDWTRKVEDIRGVVPEGWKKENKESVVIMLKSIDDAGLLITRVKLIGGRGGDNVCAWIYVPASVKITGKELEKLIDETIASVDDNKKLQQLFSKEYEQVPPVRMAKAVNSGGEKLAVRYYGAGTHYSLCELLNAQPYYRNYKRVFLLDNKDKFQCDPSWDNLTNETVLETVTVDAPGSKDGFIPYLDGQPFSEPIRCLEHDTITVEWRRKGYKSILISDSIKRTSDQYKVRGPERSQYEKLIPYSAIQVHDEWGQSMRVYELYVNGKFVKWGDEFAVREIDNKISVKIRTKGYYTYEDTIPLNTLPRTINMEKKTFTYVFSLPLENNGSCTVELTVNEKLKTSPIKGYVTKEPLELCKDSINLQYNPYDRKFWKTALIAAIVVLVLGLCGGGAITHFLIEPLLKGSDSRIEQMEQESKDLPSEGEGVGDVEDQEQESPAPTVPKNEQANVDDAILYLDDKEKWIRPDMEKYEALKGLWDAVNERDHQRLRSYEKALSESKNFKLVLEAVKANSHKTFSRPYCAQGDSVITIEKYIDELYKKQESQSPRGNKNGEEGEKEKGTSQRGWL